MSAHWNKIIGPGVMFAATAIGVSHLVQSTTAGALFGLSLLGFIVLANVLKYPFFEFGTRYAAATGKSIIEGYYELHKGWLIIYLIVTVISMFFVTAAVGIVAIGFMEHLFGLSEWTGFSKATHLLLFIGSALLLIWGRFNVLERLVKLLGIVLLVTTVVAFSLAMVKQPQGVSSFQALFPPLSTDAWAFLLPLMGWMPTAIDLSAWNSLWTIEKVKTSGYKPTVKESVKEFGIGYWISAVLALLFLVMGAYLVFGTGKIVPQEAASFSAFVVELYTTTLGRWATLLVGAAAFSIMFSTFITILDGYSRAMTASLPLVWNTIQPSKRLNALIVLLVAFGGLLLIISFENNPDGFRSLINTATTLSFIVAPIIALLNFRLVRSDKIGKENAPGKWLIVLSWLGIFYLIAFCFGYLFF